MAHLHEHTGIDWTDCPLVEVVPGKVSGVPMSEGKYDKRYGDREDYKKWKRETPMFFPKL